MNKHKVTKKQAQFRIQRNLLDFVTKPHLTVEEKHDFKTFKSFALENEEAIQQAQEG